MPLIITGGNSKTFYGRPAHGQPLVVRNHCGIINYEPTELVLTARCGTRLADIESLLVENGQILGFEPPHFGPDATLGGAIACGLSGSRRPYAGSVRDAVLGVKMINGHAEVLKFGGEVMKNVAGFDVSRLMAGALGTLGVLLEISIKVHPAPAADHSLVYRVKDSHVAIAQMLKLTNQNLPLSALCYDGEHLRIRLSGAEVVVDGLRQKLGGELLDWDEAENFWSALREHKLAFFRGDVPLWRLSLPRASVQPDIPGSWFIDWGGALRWLKTHETAATIFAQAKALGGHAGLFRSMEGGEFQALSPGLENLHRRIKVAFDPYGIFNPGRMYPDW